MNKTKRHVTKPDESDARIAAGMTRLAGLIRAHCPHDGRFEPGIPGMRMVRYSRVSSERAHTAQRPVLCIVAQGAKRLMLGSEVYIYNPSRMLVVSVDLPVAAQVVQASPTEPYLALILDLNPGKIAELQLKAYPTGMPRSLTEGRGIYLSPPNPPILDAAARLIELLGQPGELDLIAPLVIDEILIRLLRGPMGVRLAQIGSSESSLHKVANAITWLRTNYAQPMKVEELAEMAHMSVSSFHQHFKSVTSMSPLNYQKVLRLQEARRLMLSTIHDAGAASRQVGYLSASQFSREYARFFGQPPTKDITRLADQGLSAIDVTR
ncbi:MAG: AraC family transcriptional regulator [Anaerolineales bacterium]|nr:AraC family transcriptional regulator [Anaerolineales bacterium]